MSDFSVVTAFHSDSMEIGRPFRTEDWIGSSKRAFGIATPAISQTCKVPFSLSFRGITWAQG